MTKRTPSEYDWNKALFNDRRLHKHFTHPRRSPIRTITLHHMTIVVPGSGSDTTRSLEGAYQTWQSRQASANYGISGDQVWQYVSDNDAAWANANSASNHETLSIEHTNSLGAPSWEISDETLATSARLVACLHRLYGLGRPSRKTVKVHQDYYATSCPGPYLMGRLTKHIAECARVYDGLGTPTDPTPAPVRWFEHRHLNTWGDDGGKGTNSLPDRLPKMIADLTDGNPEIITLNEVRSSQRNLWRKALTQAGYDVPLADAGNLIAVPAGTKIAAASTYYLPKKVQGEGRNEALGRVRAHVNGQWVHVGVTHLDYRPQFDALRVKQAKACIRKMRRFAAWHGLRYWRQHTTIALDENSRTWVRDRAFLPAKFRTASKSGIDGIYSLAEVADAGSTTTDSDHPIVSVVYAK